MDRVMVLAVTANVVDQNAVISVVSPRTREQYLFFNNSKCRSNMWPSEQDRVNLDP